MNIQTTTARDLMCDQTQLHDWIAQIDPQAYARSRNFLDGQVSGLSPYLTHGILSTRQVAEQVLESHSAKQAYKYLFELGWREFYHRTWQAHGSSMFDDLRQPQTPVASTQLPQAIARAQTGIDVIDQGISHLLREGLMHNHLRMWIASLTCNIAATHWPEPARWLHYHLLDGDLASNTLSWQWVAGSFSHRKYLANQNNLDKYSRSRQTGTLLDHSYETLASMVESGEVPKALRERTELALHSPEILTTLDPSSIQPDTDWQLRSIWNLDPQWRPADRGRNLLLIEPDWLEAHPISQRRVDFILHWADQIEGCEVLVANFEQAVGMIMRDGSTLHFREYPACSHWHGIEHDRDWLYPAPQRPAASFSAYFKQVRHAVGL